MDWKVVGAIEQTGDEITRIFDARDRAEAESKARRAGILVSSAEPVEVVNNLGVLDYRGRPDKSPLLPLPKPPEPAVLPNVIKPRRRVRGVTRRLVNVLIALVAAVLLATVYGAFAGRGARWEYRVESPVDRVLESEVNRLGAEGWELVSARRVTADDGVAGKYELIFKRPRR